MNKNTMYILVAVVIVIIVIGGVGAYVLLNSNKPSEGPTPTPSPTTSPTASPTGGSSGIASATSLQYSVDVVAQGKTSTFIYKAKNLGAANTMLRIDMTLDTGDQFSYVLNAAQQKAWIYTAGTWMESTFATDWPTYSQQLTDYNTALASWAGTGDYTYTSPTGDSIKIYNISVNPDLPDSIFQAS